MEVRAAPTSYKVVHGNTHDLADVGDFLTLLESLDRNPTIAARTLFDTVGEIVIARAPGRLDVMGGIADYSGALVLQMPIAEATLCALQLDANRELTIVSLTSDTDRDDRFTMPLKDFVERGEVIAYDTAREYFQRDARSHWAAYVAGVFLVLMRERGVRFDRGARLLISSRVPEGSGVSSSAALEVAVMTAVAAAFDLNLEARELALLCQLVENEVVGAPCGVMDQMTAACGQADRLLALLCQPAELQSAIDLPYEFCVWGLDSGVGHSVGAGNYGSVRTGTFMGYRMIADFAGLQVLRDPGRQAVKVLDERWHGYLANITIAEFEHHFSARLPEQMTGADFLRNYEGTTDLVTHVDAERTYAVRQPVKHAIYESDRVRAFARLLQTPQQDAAALLGDLMYQSHASYSACGLGSVATDLLVGLVRSVGPAGGLFGARITGGGSGGTVALLGRRDAEAKVFEIAGEYQGQSEAKCFVFAGSSPGSVAFEYLKLRNAS